MILLTLILGGYYNHVMLCCYAMLCYEYWPMYKKGEGGGAPYIRVRDVLYFISYFSRGLEGVQVSVLVRVGWEC